MDNTEKRNQPSLQRRSFLITCWQEQDSAGGGVKWRFNLETPAMDERKLFIDLMGVMDEIKKSLDRISDLEK
jgi:hypothetical protein